MGASQTQRREARKRWAALIKQVYEADPLSCPQCGGRMLKVTAEGKVLYQSDPTAVAAFRPRSDRILIATAVEHSSTILTPDPQVRQYPDVKTFW